MTFSKTEKYITVKLDFLSLYLEFQISSKNYSTHKGSSAEKMTTLKV
jgi:hypothetical protein